MLFVILLLFIDGLEGNSVILEMSLPDQDPDYEAVCTPGCNRFAVFQKDAQEAAVKKIDTIIESQFQKEITLKEVELDLIDQHLLEGRAMLDHLRACAVAKYYATVYQIIESDSSTDTATIHPAVKEYIGKSVSELQETTVVKNDELTSQSQLDVPVFSENGQNGNEFLHVPSTVETVSNMPRLKSKFTFVVGNVSKFLLPDNRLETNDQATHKWMVYVRGDKDNPDISHLVKKVVFFLHPSYRPNDLVAITNPPFHLARRGWGEFPVRVQIHFCDTRNKPLDVIHNLKLDKTFTGLQTLGAETVAQVTLLITPNQLVLVNKNTEAPVHKNMESQDGAKTINKAIKVNSATVNNICHTAKKNLSSVSQPNTLNQPTKRSLEGNISESPVKLVRLVNNSFIKDANNIVKNNTQEVKKENLIFVTNNGPGTSNALKLIQSSASSTIHPNSLPKERTFQLLLKDGKLLKVKIQPGPLLNSLNSAVNSVNQKNKDVKMAPPGICNRKVTLEAKKSPEEDIRLEYFNTIDELMFQVVKQFPIGKSKFVWTEFLSWPVGKQRAAEWQRAKKIQRCILKLLKRKMHPRLSVKDAWTTKQIMLWCRKYGFTPFDEIIYHKLYDKDTETDLSSTCTLTFAQDLLNELSELQQTDNSEDNLEENLLVDVEHLDHVDKNVIVKQETNKAISLLLPKEMVTLECNSPFAGFVQSASSEIGLKCVPEEVEPGIMAPLVEFSMAAACKEFLHQLLHTALSCRTSSGNMNTLTKEDVCHSILTLPETEFLTNKFLGVLAHKT